jgi:hypothetical protein
VIDSVRVYLDGPSGAGALIGQATYGFSRPDIAALYGARLGPSGKVAVFGDSWY